MKKSSIFGIIVFLAVGCSGSNEDIDQIKKKNLLPIVTVSKAQTKIFSHKISVQGNIETNKDILVNSEMSGLITAMHVSSGQTIAKGQLILSMDEALIDANIAELTTQLNYATYMLSKQEELVEQGLGAEIERKAAENQFNSLNSKLKTMKIQKSKMTVRAPFSGTVDQIYAKTGQVMSPQIPILRLVNNNKVEIIASVSEKHYKNINIGSDMKVSFPNFDFEPLHLKVKSVGNFIEPTNRTFTIRAEVNNNKELMPNMLAEVEITDLSVDSGMVISSKSILKNQNNEDYVWILKKKDGKTYNVQQVLIEIISSYNGEALIVSNNQIVNGTKVIEGGARGITNKDVVRIK